MTIIVRAEKPADYTAVHAVNAAAFSTPAEADLVDALRGTAEPLVSLVAEMDKRVVGHILFSPVSLSGRPQARLMALGPMAVLPAYQRCGVGSALIPAGLDDCRRLNAAAVIVLGHPTYYPRFGFKPAVQFGLDSEYDVPDEVFMAQPLHPHGLDGLSGRITYHPAFQTV